jgi:leucyl aminopeptidase
VTLTEDSVSLLSADAVVLAAFEGDSPRVLGSGGPDLLRSLGFTGKAGSLVRIPAAALEGTFATPVIAIVGLGARADGGPTPEDLRRAAGTAVRGLSGLDTIALATGYDEPAQVGAIVEGALLGSYTFTTFHTPDSLPAQKVLVAVLDTKNKAVNQAADRARVLAAAVAAARDLVNLPANALYPEVMEASAKSAAKAAGVKVSVWDQDDLAKGGFGGIIAVGQGSIRAPRLIKLTYSPSRAKAHIALVGKGITFDSGGLSLKPPMGMLTMKHDMAGAAAVLETVIAAAQLKLPVKVTGWLAVAENMPSGSAQHPGDVITMKDGHTVEVTNTDAEGRLVLADGIAAAREDKPDALLDIATLTGAQVTALGTRMGAVMGTEAERGRVVAAGDRAGEPFWPMPLPSSLRANLDSPVADMVNSAMGDRSGGMLVAGLFLREFVGDTPWAHLDIAGPAFNEGAARDYTLPGATGWGVRTMLAYLEDRAAA